MKHKKKNVFTNINTYLIIALVIVVAVGFYFTLSVPVPQKTTVELRKVQLAVVGSDCTDCFNMTSGLEQLKKTSGLEFTQEQMIPISDADEYITKYSLARLPAVIITGEIENFTLADGSFELRESALVFDKTPPVYYDTAKKQKRGMLAVTLVEGDCDICFNVSGLVEQLKDLGVMVTSTQRVHANSTEGAQLISQYKIEKLPVFIFNDHALEYSFINDVWDQLGSTEADGKLVLRMVPPPYLDLKTNKIEGLVQFTYVIDETCTECFNETVFADILAGQFNMHVSSDERVDVASTKGKFLIKKYNVTSVPTVVLSKEAAAYSGLSDLWKQVGTQEKDGVFIFRNLDLLKQIFEQTGEAFAYRDLVSGSLKHGELVGSSSGGQEAEITAPETED